MVSFVRLALFIALALLTECRGVSLEKTEKKNGILTAKDATFALSDLHLGAEHKCLLEKTKILTPVANDIVRQLKPTAIDMLKTKEFPLPSVHESLEVAPIKIDRLTLKAWK